MNIYQMYYENNKKFGYWVQRYTWANTVAKVTSIEGVKEGENIPGRKPYHNKQKVYGEFYKINNKGEIVEKIDQSTISYHPGEITSPGTNSYTMLKEE